VPYIEVILKQDPDRSAKSRRDGENTKSLCFPREKIESLCVLSLRRVQTAAMRLLMQIYLRLNADERREAFHSSAKIKGRDQEFGLKAWSILTNSRRRTAFVESKA
jgi:hypothetical protein